LIFKNGNRRQKTMFRRPNGYGNWKKLVAGGPFPDLSVVIFRIAGDNNNALNTKFITALHCDGACVFFVDDHRRTFVDTVCCGKFQNTPGRNPFGVGDGKGGEGQGDEGDGIKRANFL
jgi:hypothetical protein